MPRNLNNISDLIVKFEAKDHHEMSPKKISSKRINGDVLYDGEHNVTKKQEVVTILSRCGKFLDLLSHLPLPWMSVTGMGITFLVAIFIFPRAITENFLFPAFRLLFGTLYPAYASYKAVRTKNVKEYVKWMMYWIVYAFFTCIETFTDIFLSWFPFYYEVKVILVIWLLSPATKGSSTLYRKFVHPMLTRREHEIDEYLNQAKEKGYTTVLQLGSKGMNYATSVIMQTAIKGGGNLVQTLKKSYSLSDLSEPDTQRTQDEIDEITKPQRSQRVLRPRTQSMRSASGGRNMPEMYFPEVDVPQPRVTRDGAPNYNYIRSSEDISSGYSSAEPLPVALSRTASLSHASRGATRLRSKRSEARENSWEDDGEGDYPFSPSSCPQSPISTSSLSSLNAPKFPFSFDGEPLYLVEEEDGAESGRIVDIPENFHQMQPKGFAEMAEKYRMFEIWLKTQQNCIQNPISDDFQDILSEKSSSEDEFHEFDGDNELPDVVEEVTDETVAVVEEPSIYKENEGNENPTTSKEQQKVIEDFKEITTDSNEAIVKTTEIPKEELKNLFEVAEIKDPSLDEGTKISEVEEKDEDIPNTVRDILPPPLNKKSPSHGKGKAPEPPAIPQQNSSLAPEETARNPDKKAQGMKRENHLIELLYASAKPQNGENAQN